MYSTDIRGLGDKVNPPLGQGFWDKTLFLWGVIANSYYEQSVMDVVYALNWNDGLLDWMTGATSWEDVASIFNAYGNGVENKKISVFEYEKLTPEQRDYIINYVAKSSGYNAKLVGRVLKQLYYYVKDGTIKFDGILRPGNLSMYAKNSTIPDGLKTHSNSQGGDNNIWTILGLPSWTGTALLGIAIVGVGAFAVMQADNIGLIGKD